MQTGKHNQRGFGYLMALFAVAALGLLAATAGQVWHTTAQRAREADLLFAGQQYRLALTSYYNFAVGGKHQYPSNLQELLEDHRSQVTLRHLRHIYIDPMTGQADWVLVTTGDRIVGLHSRSLMQPFKRKFDGVDAAFNDADTYAQWVFRPAVSEQATGPRRGKQ